MREKALKIGFVTALALLTPGLAVCSSHTSKAVAHPVHPVAAVSRPHVAAVRAVPVKAGHVVSHTTAHAGMKAAGKPVHSREVAATSRKGHEVTTAPARRNVRPLTKAEQRAQAAEDARASRLEAALNHGKGLDRGKALSRSVNAQVQLASTRHPLREELPARSASLHPGTLATLRQPVAAAPQHVASLSAGRPLPEPEETAAAPAAFAPISVHHNRKQHLTAEDQAQETQQPAASDANRPSPSHSMPAGAPLSGVSHPDEMDEQAPLTPVVKAHPGSSPTAQLAPGGQATPRLQPVPGIGRQTQSAANAQRSAIGSPLVMAAVTVPPTSAIMTSTESLPPPAVEPQQQPSAAVRARLPSIESEVVETQLVPALLYNNHGQLVVPPALRGSREILVHQNTEANREGLARVRDDADLTRMRAQRLLVMLPDETGLAVDDRLPANRRFARPWTAKFLADIARAHYAHFHTDLIVTSAVRTVEVQQRLIRTNGNAAPAEGETASPHLTGQAVDLGKNHMSMTEIAWMRGYLLPLVEQGKVDVEEEFQQACFHISVYRGYGPAAPASGMRRSAASSLATALPIK